MPGLSIFPWIYVHSVSDRMFGPGRGNPFAYSPEEKAGPFGVPERGDQFLWHSQ